MKSIGLFLCILLGSYTLNAQQKAMHSQYFFNALAVNPAYSATDEAISITALSRQQWVGFAGAPNTQTLSIRSPLNESKTSIGGILIRDQIADVLTETGGYLSVAQGVQLSEKTSLALGLTAGLSTFKANYSENYETSPTSANDPTFTNEKQLRTNLGFGVLIYSDKYFLGFSSPYFFYRDVESIFTKVPSTRYRPNYILHGGYIADINESIKFKPNFLINYVNGSPLGIDANASFLFQERIWAGLSYRFKSSYSAILQIYINPKFAVGYSYDVSSNALAGEQRGSHEITLQYRMTLKGRSANRCYF